MTKRMASGNFIAEQLGVPTPYLVRHAAFLYETQLRGIQQQLRLSEVSKAPSSAANTPPPSQRRTISTSRSSSNRQSKDHASVSPFYSISNLTCRRRVPLNSSYHFVPQQHSSTSSTSRDGWARRLGVIHDALGHLQYCTTRVACNQHAYQGQLAFLRLLLAFLATSSLRFFCFLFPPQEFLSSTPIERYAATVSTRYGSVFISLSLPCLSSTITPARPNTLQCHQPDGFLASASTG